MIVLDVDTRPRGLMFAACACCWAPHLAKAIKALEGS